METTPTTNTAPIYNSKRFTSDTERSKLVLDTVDKMTADMIDSGTMSSAARGVTSLAACNVQLRADASIKNKAMAIVWETMAQLHAHGWLMGIDNVKHTVTLTETEPRPIPAPGPAVKSDPIYDELRRRADCTTAQADWLNNYEEAHGEPPVWDFMSTGAVRVETQGVSNFKAYIVSASGNTSYES